MNNLIKTVILILSITVSSETIAQNKNQPEALVNIKSSEAPKPFLQYLFDTYGIEDSEKILLSIESYETQNSVKILSPDKYQEQTLQIASALSKKISKKEYNRLIILKESIINFSEIESILTKK